MARGRSRPPNRPISCEVRSRPRSRRQQGTGCEPGGDGEPQGPGRHPRSEHTDTTMLSSIKLRIERVWCPSHGQQQLRGSTVLDQCRDFFFFSGSRTPAAGARPRNSEAAVPSTSPAAVVAPARRPQAAVGGGLRSISAAGSSSENLAERLAQRPVFQQLRVSSRASERWPSRSGQRHGPPPRPAPGAGPANKPGLNSEGGPGAGHTIRVEPPEGGERNPARAQAHRRASSRRATGTFRFFAGAGETEGSARCAAEQRLAWQAFRTQRRQGSSSAPGGDRHTDQAETHRFKASKAWDRAQVVARRCRNPSAVGPQLEPGGKSPRSRPRSFSFSRAFAFSRQARPDSGSATGHCARPRPGRRWPPCPRWPFTRRSRPPCGLELAPLLQQWRRRALTRRCDRNCWASWAFEACKAGEIKPRSRWHRVGGPGTRKVKLRL